MTSARFSRADIREILNNTTISDILPCGYNDLRAVRFRDIRENAECGFLFAALSLRNRCAPGGGSLKQSDFVDESAIQVEPSILLKCFKSLPLRNRPARGRGQT